MPDIAQARAEKATDFAVEYLADSDRCGLHGESSFGDACIEIQLAAVAGYERGWTESQREPISDAEVEAGAEAIWGGVSISWHDGHPEDKANCRETARTVLEAATQVRASAESEKP